MDYSTISALFLLLEIRYNSTSKPSLYVRARMCPEIIRGIRRRGSSGIRGMKWKSRCVAALKHFNDAKKCEVPIVNMTKIWRLVTT